MLLHGCCGSLIAHFQGEANEAIYSLHPCVESPFPKNNSDSKHNHRSNSIMKTPSAYLGLGFCCLLWAGHCLRLGNPVVI